MTTTPAITVMTCVYNGREFIPRCHHSLARQTFQGWEWLVIDDGSTDGTGDSLAALARADDRIRVLRHSPNRGRAYARDRALHHARGEWVALWDVDDFFFPERLAEIDRARRAGWDYWGSRAIQTDIRLNTLGVQDFDRPFPGLDTRTCLHGALAFRLDLGRRIGYSPHLRTYGGMGEDAAIVYTLALKHRGFLEPEPLMVNVTGNEVVLRKSMDARRVVIATLEALWRAGDLPLSREVMGGLLARLRHRNRVLSLLKLCPPLYPAVMRLRMRGDRADGAIPEVRLAFIRELAERFPTHAAPPRPRRTQRPSPSHVQ